jgi:transposase-like protein
VIWINEATGAKKQSISMKISEITCPACGSCYAVAESATISGSPGHVECAVCGEALANWTTPSFRAYRLELAPEHKYVRVPAPPPPVHITT